MPKICVDIDNVVARTDQVMREVIREYSQDCVDLDYEDVVCFDYWMCRDKKGRRFDKGEWNRIHIEFARNHLSRILPFENVSEHLGLIRDRFEVHLVTSRLPEGRYETERWVKKHAIPHDRIQFVPHGQKHLTSERFDAAIDDDREQAYAFALSGMRSFLLAHPWNQIGAFSPIQRVARWEELTVKILSLT